MTTFKSFSLIGFIFLSTACGARSTSHNVGNGSNTNWLSGCKVDSKCGDGICAGGACTETCNTDDDCSHLSPDAKCADAVPFVSSDASSCDDAEPRRVCSKPCNEYSDCADIGDGYTCAGGECVPGACVDPWPTSPCENLACGESCNPCPADDRDCEANSVVHMCNLDGECVDTDVACTAADCPNVAPDRCQEFGCIALDGHAVTGECNDWTLEPVGCAPFDSGDSAIGCAINPTDSLCYQFPTTTTPSFWETADCEDERCVLPDCPTDECFSPTENVDRAYDGDLQGCECDPSQGDVCVGPAGLVCGEDGRWQAVEDGPCEPIDTPCLGELADPRECIALFNLCVEQGDIFCGVNSLTALCPIGVIVDSETDCASDAECTKLDNGLWCASSVRLPEDECFSPTQNLDRRDELPSCPCNEEQGDVCLDDDSALLCGEREWIEVLYDVCLPEDQPCLGLLADPYQCIALFDTCDKRGDVFCGGSPLTTLCEGGLIVDTAADCPDTASTCTELANGLWCASPLPTPCAEYYEPVDSCEDDMEICYSPSPSVTCQLQHVTLSECEDMGGNPVAPSLPEPLQACPPAYGPAIGNIQGWGAEGGLCCAPLADAGARDAGMAE